MKLERLISILVILLRKERIRAKELAEMFDVSTRTILRDIDTINLAGIPIVTYQGTNGGIGIAEGYRLDRSVLTGEEMATIITALRGVATTVTDPKHEVLMEKFKNTLSAPQLEMLNSRANQFIIDMTPWGGNELLKEKIRALRQAIEESREVTFTYTDSNGTRTKRRIEPYSLVLKAQKWYLYAWCLDREAFRIFKLSRIKELQFSDRIFTRRDLSIDQLILENQWSNTDNMIELDLVFEKNMESIVCDWFGEEVIERNDGKLMVKAFLPENNWLYGFLLSFGTGVEVVNPAHLRSVLASLAKEIFEKYSNHK